MAAATAATAATSATPTTPASATTSALPQPHHLYTSAAAALWQLYISLTVDLYPLAASRCCKLWQRLNMLHAAAELQQLLQRLQMLQQRQRLQLLQPAQLHTRCGMALARRQLCHICTEVLQPMGRSCAAALRQSCGRAAVEPRQTLCWSCGEAVAVMMYSCCSLAVQLLYT